GPAGISGSKGKIHGPERCGVRPAPPGWPPRSDINRPVSADPTDSAAGIRQLIRTIRGLDGIAHRTLELYTTAVLEATLLAQPQPQQAWRSRKERLAEVSRAAYRRTVYEDPRFVEYFRAAT